VWVRPVPCHITRTACILLISNGAFTCRCIVSRCVRCVCVGGGVIIPMQIARRRIILGLSPSFSSAPVLISASPHSWDFVYVYDGAGFRSPRLAAYSGEYSPVPPPVISTGPELLVHFYSDQAQVRLPLYAPLRNNAETTPKQRRC
jgi:hypothetical protein